MAKEYQGSATGGAFSPNKTLRTGDNSKENENRYASTLSDYGQIQGQNDRTRVDNARKQEQGIEKLSKFSAKLSEKLVKDQQAKNLEDYEAGIADAYMNGIPEAEAEAFNKQEAAVNIVGQETDALGAEYSAISGSRSQGEQISASSGWRALGRATGMAKQGAAQYPLYIAMNAEKLASASTPQEYAATLAELRKEYTGKFSGMNRAMMGKYMFPKMQEFEATQFLNWQEKNNEMIMNDRVDEMGGDFYTEVINGKGGAGFLEFIEKNKHFLGGRKNARNKLFEIIKDGIANGKITRDQADALGDFPFPGENTTLGRKFARDFDSLDDDIKAEAAQTYNQEQAEIRIRQGEIVKSIRAYQQQAGRRLTNEEKTRIMGELPPGLPVPQELKNMLTMEDIESDAVKERVEAKISAGYDITEADLEGLDYNDRQQYQNSVRGAGKASGADNFIKSVVNQRTEENDGDIAKTPNWERMNARAQSRFKELYQKNLRGGMDPGVAQNSAQEQVRLEVENGSINGSPIASGGSKTASNTVEGVSALTKDPDLYLTTTIPGTEDSLKQLSDMVQKNQTGGGVPTIPQMYHVLASGIKGMSGFDLANQQLQLNGLPPLIKPQAEQYIDGLSDATIKEWMTYKPTPSRAMRTIQATGDSASFLDLVAGVESRGDYNAFNLGGSDGGHTAHGSGYTGDGARRWGRELTQMTIGEVMEIGASPSAENRWVHAAGRYQIIPDTLRGLVKRHGIDPNAPFDEAMQDQLAMYLAYGRLVQSNKITGLRNEWIGLNHVGADKIKASLGQAYNNPELLLKGV